MKHPKIVPHEGLPATSDLPWSAREEKRLRRTIRVDQGVILSAVLSTIGFAVKHSLAGVALAIAVEVVVAIDLIRRHQRWHALMLNKPRSMQNLTQWTQHPWRGWDHEQLQFACECGRAIDFSLPSTFFPETQRRAQICECGRGHFQVPPFIAGRGVEQ